MLADQSAKTVKIVPLALAILMAACGSPPPDTAPPPDAATPPGAATSPSAATAATPPDEVIVSGVCPFAGCRLGAWTAREEVPL
jgi:hypothetical protein